MCRIDDKAARLCDKAAQSCAARGEETAEDRAGMKLNVPARPG
jgi:hypothetical protein